MVTWNPPPEEPNASCPICSKPVWFFRNKNGGCAYFDAIGKPWPLHPCMEKQQSAEDRRAAIEARAAYDRALETSPRFRARQTARVAVLDSVSRVDQQRTGSSFTTAAPAKQESDDDEPLDWMVVLGGFFALLLSLPVSWWVNGRFEWIPPLLTLWAFIVPTVVMAFAIGWFLVRASRSIFEASDVIGSLVISPILLALGIAGNLLSCGLGVPLAAVWVVSEANTARKRDQL